jgi:hypothetical protein
MNDINDTLIWFLSVFLLGAYLFTFAVAAASQGPSLPGLLDDVTTEVTTQPMGEVTEPETTTEPEPITEPITETSPPETEPVVTQPTVTRPVEGWHVELTDEEKRILATLIRLEAGGSSYECQMGVGSVVLNRMKLFGLSLEQVVFEKNVFSPARLINVKNANGEYKYQPYEQNWRVVEDLCKDGPTLPYYVIYFRAGRHHTWATPYCQIDTTYFSYAEKYK